MKILSTLTKHTGPSLLWTLLLLSLGCSGSLTRFDGLIAAGDYKKAALAAAEDPQDTRDLAVALLTWAIENGREVGTNTDALMTSRGSTGRRALKRLCDRAGTPASLHACIARSGRRPPRRSVLKRYLASDYGDVRARAARKWAHKLKRKQLIPLLEDFDPGVRQAAVIALGQSRSSIEVADILRNTLRSDPVATVRSAAAKSGPSLGREALLALKAALKDENLGVRLAALEGLSQTREPAAVDILKNTAHGPIDEMAVVAIVELLRTGERGMEHRLEAALQSGRIVIRKAALLRLERSKIANRPKLLAKALQDPSTDVVLLAARLLSKWEDGVAAAKAALRKIMARDTLETAPARYLLATLGDKEAIDTTKERLISGGEAEILTIMKNTARCSELSSTFAGLMGHEKENIRTEAARASLRATNQKNERY